MLRKYEFQDSKGNDYTFDGNSFRFLRGKNIDSIDFPELDLKATSPYPRTLALTVTNNCNMGCKYCYANKGSWDKPGVNMSEGIAKKAVDLLVDTVKAAGGDLATISFFWR